MKKGFRFGTPFQFLFGSHSFCSEAKKYINSRFLLQFTIVVTLFQHSLIGFI